MGNQRQANRRFESLRENALGDVRTELFDFAATDGNRLAGLNRATGRRAFDGNGQTFLDQSLAHGKVERMDLQSLRLRIVKREARIFVRHQTVQRIRHRFEQLVQIEHGDHRVIHFEQEPQTIALFFELLLNGLGFGKIMRVVHRHRDLARHLLQEYDVGFGVHSFMAAAERERADFSQRRGHRDDAQRLHPTVAQPARQFGKFCVLSQARNHPRLLRLPNPAAGRFHRTVAGRASVSRVGGFQHVRLYRFAVGIVENQIGKLELHDAMQARRKLGVKLVQLALRRNRFGDLQKRLILAVQRIHRLALCRVIIANAKSILRSKRGSRRPAA